MSTVMLRTVLLACAISGALVFACGEDTTTENNNSRGDDDDEGDDDEDDDNDEKKDSSTKKDASTKKDGGKDSGSTAECTGSTPMLCTGDDGEMGIQLCMNGKLGACTTAGSIAGDAATVEMCPVGFMCQTIPMIGSFCSNGGRVTCETAEDCTAAGLEGASCTMLPFVGNICQLRCTGGGAPSTTPDGGSSTTSDSGSSSADSGSSDSSTGSADGSRDSSTARDR